MATKKVTLLEMAQAIQMNGYPKIKGSMGNEQGACAIGQGAINLGVSPDSLYSALNQLNICGWYKDRAGDSVMSLNDNTNKSVGEIGKQLVKFAEKWPDLEFTVVERYK